MEIYILSKGRAHKQITWANLPSAIQGVAKIAVYPEELPAYAKYPTISVNCKERGVGHKRQWLIEQCKSRYICMLDDDLTFATRRDDDPTKFLAAAPAEVSEMFTDISQHLQNGYAHVGVASREGGNRRTEQYMEVGRMMRVLAYDIDALAWAGARFDEVQLMEDFNVTLRLLREGKPNCILNWIVQNQSGSNAVGGVSTYRTMEKQTKAAMELARLHPGFVGVVEKSTKTAWGGGVRTDVVIQWRKAYDSAK